MANVLIENSTMQDIADAIREKDGSSATMLPSAMAAKILAIPSGSTSNIIIDIKRGVKKTFTDADWQELSQLNGVGKGFNTLFSGTQLTGPIVIKGITALDTTTFANTFSSCTKITDVTFQDLENIPVQASSGLMSCFGDSSITSISFPSLVHIVGGNAMQQMCIRCSSLTSISLPVASDLSGNAAIGGFNGTFNNCPALVTAELHPILLKHDGIGNILNSAPGIVNLTLTATAVEDINLTWQASLSSASVLNVLNHLSTEATGKSCNFKDLTIASSDTNHAAIAAKVASLTNWTITGLTI